jgi:hypothetical protein
VPGACAADGGLALLFFGDVGQGRLRRGVGQEAGDELIGELAEGEVDLGLQGSEGGGVARELLGPELLLSGKVIPDLLKGLVRRRDRGALLGVEPNTHGKSFRRGMSLLLPTIATQAANGSPFWEWTRSRSSPSRRTVRPRLSEPQGGSCNYGRMNALPRMGLPRVG